MTTEDREARHAREDEAVLLAVRVMGDPLTRVCAMNGRDDKSGATRADILRHINGRLTQAVVSSSLLRLRKAGKIEPCPRGGWQATQPKKTLIPPAVRKRNIASVFRVEQVLVEFIGDDGRSLGQYRATGMLSPDLDIVLWAEGAVYEPFALRSALRKGRPVLVRALGAWEDDAFETLAEAQVLLQSMSTDEPKDAAPIVNEEGYQSAPIRVTGTVESTSLTQPTLAELAQAARALLDVIDFAPQSAHCRNAARKLAALLRRCP